MISNYITLQLIQDTNQMMCSDLGDPFRGDAPWPWTWCKNISSST